MPDDVDPDLLRRFVQGDLGAFETLFKRFELDVYRWILRIIRDRSAAEDVTVDAFWRAYRGRGRFDPSRSFGAWMRRIATNAARDQLKAAPRFVKSSDADGSIAAPEGSDPDVGPAIARAFRKLPVKLRIVATLALIEERPYVEIADALDVPVGTVKSRVFRAVRALRKELAHWGVQR